jgi:hypothetical protein
MLHPIGLLVQWAVRMFGRAERDGDAGLVDGAWVRGGVGESGDCQGESCKDCAEFHGLPLCVDLQHREIVAEAVFQSRTLVSPNLTYSHQIGHTTLALAIQRLNA